MSARPGDVRLTGSLLVATNLLPLAGVLFGGWQVFAVILLYWLENLVLGALQLVRILLVPVPSDAPAILTALGKLFLAAFFTVHFGMFCFVHGAFVFGLFAPEPLRGRALPLPAPAELARQVNELGLTWPLAGLAASHVISFVRHFLAGGERVREEAQRALFGVYPRVVALHVAILVGAGFVLFLSSATPALVVLILGKTAIDLAAHRRQHRRLAEPPSGAREGLLARLSGRRG